jgi:hypothetical protein
MRAGEVAQAIQRLMPSKSEALSSKPITTKKKKKVCGMDGRMRAEQGRGI